MIFIIILTVLLFNCVLMFSPFLDCFQITVLIILCSSFWLTDLLIPFGFSNSKN